MSALGGATEASLGIAGGLVDVGSVNVFINGIWFPMVEKIIFRSVAFNLRTEFL